MTLTLTRSVYGDLFAHAREGAPREVCGVLGGTAGEDARVTVARRVPNVADSPHSRYELDPAAQVHAMEAIEADGAVVGFYHSHPRGPDHPSGVDEALATWAGYAYVIVSLAGDPGVGSWRWTGERFEAERVRVQSA